MLFGWEEGDEAVDRRRHVGGVDRGEDEMTGLGCFQRRIDGFQVTHLSDHDDVRVLPERRAKCVGERRRVRPDLALRDDAFIVREDEFDRVLDGDDLALSLTIDLVQHRGERRGFTHAGRPRDEHIATANLCDVAEDGG